MPARFATKSVLPILVCLALAGCFKSSEERAAEHYENGLALMASGDNDRAMVEFRNTLKYAREDVDARRRMGEIQLGRGSKMQAYRSYLGVVELLPDDLEGRTVLSELAFQLGDWGEFERHASQAAKLIETQGDAVPEGLVRRSEAMDLALRYRAAVVDEDLQAQVEIVETAEALQQQDPENAILRKILINAYVQDKRYAEALEQLDAAILAEPRVLENYGARLDLLSRTGDEAGIEAELDRMVELFPEDQNVKATYLRFLNSRGKQEEAEAFLRAEVEKAGADQRDDAFTALIAYVMRTRGIEAALEETNKALAEDPNSTLQLMQASLTFDNGQTEAAIQKMEAIVANDDNALAPVQMERAKVTLARMLADTGNEVGARQRVEEVLADNPNQAGALKLKARWQIEEDDTEAAINGLRSALASDPQDLTAMELMARAYGRAGNTNLRLSFLSQAVEASNNAPAQSLRYAQALIADDKALQAESTLIDSLRITPGNVDVLSLLGRVYLQLEDDGRAEQVVSTLRRIGGDAAQNNANSINLELVAKREGNDQALKLLEGLATSDESSASDQVKLSLIRGRLMAGETESALSYARELAEEEPDNMRYRYALALTHVAMRNFPDAEVELRKLLEENPAIVQVWLQLARIRSATGDAAEALALLDEGLAEVPGAPDLLWGKASLLQQGGDIDGAIEIFEGLYEQNSDSLIVANNLASLLATYRKNDPDSVARAALIARRLVDATQPALQDTYGWIAHLDGRSEEAVSYLEPAAAGLPQDVAVQVHLGLVYAALGRKEDAITQLRRALEVGGPLSGNEALLEEARAKIAELEAAPAAPTGESTEAAD